MPMKKSFLEEKRARVRELFFEKHLNKSEISRRLLVSRKFVRKWIKTQDTKKDNRGWPKRKRRKYNQEEIERIKKIRKELKQKKFLFGSDSIQDVYRNRYLDDRLPSLFFIEDVLRREGLIEPYSRQKDRGNSWRRHYPAESIKKLGRIIKEADFVGPRYIKGEKKPFHLFSRSYSQPFKLGKISLILSQKSVLAMEILIKDWKKYPLPDILKLDNDFAFTGTGKHKRVVPAIVRFLLNLDVAPLFIAPGQSWNNANVEGLNSIFAKKLWQNKIYSSLREFKSDLRKFNQEYSSYQTKKNKNFGSLENLRYLPRGFQLTPILYQKVKDIKGKKIYFLRIVREENNQAIIEILKEPIIVPDAYLNQFVLTEVNLEKQSLKILYEEEKGQLKLIKNQKFKTKYK